MRATARVAVLAVSVALVGSTTVAGSQAAPAHRPPRPKPVNLTILATTDVHGNVYDWDYFKDAPYAEPSGDSVGLARVASVVKRVRAERGAEHVMVVDNGDTLQGTPLTYYYAKQEPVNETGRDHPMAQAYNEIGYDAQVAGNHEFNYGLPLLEAYRDDVDMPVLGANVIDEKTDEPYLEPYTLVRKKVRGAKPITVGVVGLTTPGSQIWDKANVEGKLRFQGMVEAARIWVPRVRAAGADVVVVLSHAGVGGSSSYDNGLPPENPTDQIARQVPGIDVIVYGHTHRDVPQSYVTNEQTGRRVLLTQPYRWAATVSQIDLRLEKTRGQWDVASSSAEAVRAKDFPQDQRVIEALAEEHRTTVAYVNQVVATSVQELAATESRYRDTPILDFIQHIQTETVDQALEGTEYADLPVTSLAAPFSRTAVFPQGDVTIRDIAGLYIYDNTLEAVKLTGAQLRDYLEFSAQYYAHVPAGGTFDPERDTGAGGTPDYNNDLLAGLDYEIDLSEPVGSRIENLSYAGGRAVAPSDELVVAVNNYRRSGGGNFPHISTAPVVYNEQREIRQLLIDWAQAKGTIDPADFYDENWQLTVGGVPAVD